MASVFEAADQETLDSLQETDADHNGRIDCSERSALSGRLQVDAAFSTLTYDSSTRSITTILSPEAPQLNGRFKDVDGITDHSKKPNSLNSS